MEESFFDNLTAVTSNIEEISFSKYAIITEVNDDNTVNCREKETETIHHDVLCLNNSNNVGDTVLLGFVDNDVYNPLVIGNLNQKGGIGGKLSDFVNDVGFITSDYHDDSKVDKVEGKQLSSNDFTNSEKTKLEELENYDDTDIKSDIQDLQTNKQNKLTAGSNITIVDDVINAVGGGTAQVQSDYAQTDSTQVDYIKNKPDIRALVIDVLNEKFDGMISNVAVENGKLKVNRFNSGDFDDE